MMENKSLMFRRLALVGLVVAQSACSSAGGPGNNEGSGGSGLGGSGSTGMEVPEEGDDRADWFLKQTVALRGSLSVPSANAWLTAAQLAPQLVEYDPGSTARCAVEEDSSYATLLDELGGVRWGYGVTVLPDTSKPEFLSGLRERAYLDAAPGSDADGGTGVEIAEADIVGLSETSALYLSNTHGLLLVDLSGDNPQFKCAAKLPGQVDQFYMHQGRLVVMVQDAQRLGSHLLHFSLANDELSFIESVDLGQARVLDSRRFNDRLVMYTDLRVGDQPPTGGYNPGGYYGDVAPSYWGSSNQNRMIRVFAWGDTLQEELTETHIDDTPSEQYLTRSDFDRETPTGTVVSTSSRMSSNMWASDHYFVVSESQTDTVLTGWETRSYSVCVDYHYEPESYEYCTTEYEERPNPKYVEPDNNGGDRACSGATLATCIRKVAEVSSKTIQVPVGRSCETIESERFVCDRTEYQSYTYPTFSWETYSKLHIYEYTDQGFIRFADEVSDIDVENLQTTDPDATVDTLALADEAAELRIQGEVQAVQFQNGFLYVISNGSLQSYALSENSLLRTSQLEVTSDALQATKFTPDKLYLAAGGWQQSGEQSILKVIDLSNAAFPEQSSTDRTLPGSHQLILPTTSGILTTGAVNVFEGQSVNLVKVGLFEDPSTVELSYLFLGTDLAQTYSGDTLASYFDSSEERLFWPYSGTDLDNSVRRNRIGISHVLDQKVVSEGAVELALAPERVRPRPGTEQMMSFAGSEIQTLAPGDETWTAAPVFEYFTPVAVYRISDEEDYVEVLNLGNRCKLHFAAAPQLNARRAESTSGPFECSGWPSFAHEQNILWNDKLAVHFDDEGTVTVLDADEAAALWDKAVNRDVCLLSDDIVPYSQSNVVDPKDAPPLDDLLCFTREEFREYEAEKLGYN